MALCGFWGLEAPEAQDGLDRLLAGKVREQIFPNSSRIEQEGGRRHIILLNDSRTLACNGMHWVCRTRTCRSQVVENLAHAHESCTCSSAALRYMSHVSAAWDCAAMHQAALAARRHMGNMSKCVDCECPCDCFVT